MMMFMLIIIKIITIIISIGLQNKFSEEPVTTTFFQCFSLYLKSKEMYNYLCAI
jgi:hypothetical protein